ncbi:polysaccharide deacetylase family protein [Salinimicrobium sp. TH3]|uniref:polysaccharide deacetylase family protein n=1 Tax=Salinimicrobium sp. TH3 TaxID=2997342 RepID=UPI0022765529|nr:polysaccharide deacetylase family protein [Salinimicrobium sp. TH3]MCY2686962.1 polysaccharide deacetylase family protein [Salinimicrobium sp. TH3]
MAYHDIVDEANFETQIIWLKSQYNIIDISTLKDHLFYNKKLPVHPLLITLDDGDITVFKKGFPVLKKYKIGACLFIITDLINSSKDFWWNTIRKNEKKKGLSEKDILKLINESKALSNKDRIQLLEKYPATSQQQLTIDEVKELEKDRVFIGNHSHTHPMFDKLEKKDLINELEQAKNFFEKNDVGDYRVFAYPNGNLSEYTEALLQEKGIEMAFLFDHKVNEKKINPFRISRIAVDSDTPLTEFKTKVSGLHPLILKVKKQF